MLFRPTVARYTTWLVPNEEDGSLYDRRSIQDAKPVSCLAELPPLCFIQRPRLGVDLAADVFGPHAMLSIQLSNDASGGQRAATQKIRVLAGMESAPGCRSMATTTLRRRGSLRRGSVARS